MEVTTTALEGMAAAVGAMAAEATTILRPVSRLPSRTTVAIMDTMGIMAGMDSLSRRTRQASRLLGDRLVSRRLGGGMGVTMISTVDGERWTR